MINLITRTPVMHAIRRDRDDPRFGSTENFQGEPIENLTEDSLELVSQLRNASHRGDSFRIREVRMKVGVSEIDALISDLEKVRGGASKPEFYEVFERGCQMLALNDLEAARLFDTSVPNISRWRSGRVVPPAADMILNFLRDELSRKKLKMSGT